MDLPCEEVVTLLTWEEYDMNMYRLGCEHQRALGWENPDNDREKLIGRKCPECGHRFGCEWGKVDLPDDLVKYVRKRMAEKDG